MIVNLGFPTGRDSATFRDKGTKVSSLSRDKETMGQAQNLATGQNGPGLDGPDFESLSRPIARQDTGQKKKRVKKLPI